MKLIEVYCDHSSRLNLSKLSQSQAFNVLAGKKQPISNEIHESSYQTITIQYSDSLLRCLCEVEAGGLLQALFNKIYSLTFMKSSARLLGDQYEDSQVESMDCCAPLVRSSSSVRSIANTRRSQQSLKDGQEKGIKLTYKPKTAKFISETHLVIKRSEPLKLCPRLLLKQEESSPLPQGSQLNSTPSIKKTNLVQMCISYKNARIEEHSKGQIEYRSSHHLECSLKQEELCSTRKHTARTLKNSEDCSLLERESHNFFNSIRVEQSWKFGLGSQRKLVIGPKQNVGKKTLEKVFEETQGRRIVTLESQYQNDEASNEHSIAEPFEFPRYN